MKRFFTCFLVLGVVGVCSCRTVGPHIMISSWEVSASRLANSATVEARVASLEKLTVKLPEDVPLRLFPLLQHINCRLAELKVDVNVKVYFNEGHPKSRRWQLKWSLMDLGDVSYFSQRTDGEIRHEINSNSILYLLFRLKSSYGLSLIHLDDAILLTPHISEPHHYDGSQTIPSCKGNNRTKQTDAAGKITFWQYDVDNRVIAEIRKVGDTNPAPDADDTVTSYTYDDAGNMLTVTDPNGHTTTTDALGHLSGTHYYAKCLTLKKREEGACGCASRDACATGRKQEWKVSPLHGGQSKLAVHCSCRDSRRTDASKFPYFIGETTTSPIQLSFRACEESQTSFRKDSRDSSQARNDSNCCVVRCVCPGDSRRQS
jgi:YD repeat-containing protein